VHSCCALESAEQSVFLSSCGNIAAAPPWQTCSRPELRASHTYAPPSTRRRASVHSSSPDSFRSDVHHGRAWAQCRQQARHTDQCEDAKFDLLPIGVARDARIFQRRFEGPVLKHRVFIGDAAVASQAGLALLSRQPHDKMPAWPNVHCGFILRSPLSVLGSRSRERRTCAR
jgi:hypothetical protein